MDCCPSCGEVLDADAVIYNGLHYCKECGEEKRFGVLGPPPVSTPSLIRFHQELNPWQAIAIRALEGD